MTRNLSLVGVSPELAVEKYSIFLRVAAKIVETIAFETAQHRDAKKTEQLLALACAIEEEAEAMAAPAYAFSPKA